MGIGSAAPTAQAAVNSQLPHSLAIAVVAVIADCRPEAPWASLSPSARHVLSYLIVRARASCATMASWAFKTRIAVGTGLSESTVYRALAELEDGDWIDRMEQDRKNRSGRLHVARIALTAWACKVLGLKPGRRQDGDARMGPEQETPTPTKEDDAALSGEGAPAAPPSILKDGHIRGNSPLESQQDQSSRQPAGGARSETMRTQTPIKTKPGALPSDVAWLRDRAGLSQGQVFTLMKAYTAAGHRLGVALGVLKQHLLGKDASRVFAYLKVMAGRGVNFGAVQEMREADARQSQAKAIIANTVHRISGMRRLRRVNDGAEFVIEYGSARSLRDGGCAPINARLAERFLAGAYVEVDAS